MRSRFLLLLPALALAVASISCPWTDEAATTLLPEPAPRLTVSPPAPTPAAAPPAPKPAATAAPVDPALLVTLPPELVDDGSDDVKEADPPPPSRRPEVDELASTAKETWVFAEPHWKARRIGYLRAGAIVERRAEAVAKNHACPEGWYRVEPHGYVCVGGTATLNVSDAVVETSAKRPRRDGLPYAYVMTRFPPPPFYARLPSAAELLKVEPDIKIAPHLRWSCAWILRRSAQNRRQL